MTTVAFLGYGRFGAALGALFREGGAQIRALDLAWTTAPAEPPEEVRARSIAELVTGADFVIVAVPVTEMRAAFEALRPALGPTQIVIDVGSVKVGPARAMAEGFGADVPWVATHPLFGPVSLSRGERPRNVVLCPNPLHAAAVERVAALFEGAGCDVIREEPEAHDRVMASTHALAFFIAKGLIDMGVPGHAPYAPPSFQAIERTVEAVRADAGHLFAVLHRENPYAAEARRRLLESLSSIDRRLDAPPDPQAPAALAIAELAPHSPELRETRELIDELDREIVAKLAQRAQLSRRAALAKAALGRGIVDPAREAQLVADRRRWAEQLGLGADAIDDVFQAILRFSRGVQGPGDPAAPAESEESGGASEGRR